MRTDVSRFSSRVVVFCVLAAGLAVGCDLAWQRRLVGQWRSESRPQRTLDLFADRTYNLRLSGKGLGFLSDIVGPERGTWSVDNQALLMVRKGEGGDETRIRWPINQLSGDSVVLAGERWQRVVGGS